jgi:hypothetical protein
LVRLHAKNNRKYGIDKVIRDGGAFLVLKLLDVIIIPLVIGYKVVIFLCLFAP